MYSHTQPRSIQALFGSIATRYDLGNRVVTLGLYPLWNHRLVAEISRPNVHHLLDLCAGTGEVAVAFLKKNPKARVTLLDFCPEMLQVAAKRCAPYPDRWDLLEADALAIPLRSSSVDAVTVAYGVRNVADPRKCFEEVFRVLRPGGLFGVLEGTRPKSRLLYKTHRLYMRTTLPLLGKIISGNKAAYSYLAKTIDAFTAPQLLEKMLYEVGFSKVKLRPQLGGVATLIFAEK